METGIMFPECGHRHGVRLYSDGVYMHEWLIIPVRLDKLTEQPRQTEQRLGYTQDQLRTVIALQRVRMTWVMFWFSLIVFVVILCLLFYSIFLDNADVWTRVVLASLDGVVASNMRRIVVFLFPKSLP